MRRARFWPNKALKRIHVGVCVKYGMDISSRGKRVPSL